MGVEGIESGVGGVWQAQQTVAGTAEASTSRGVRRLRKDGDDGLNAAKSYGSAPYVDGRRYASPTMFVDRVGGEVGTFTAQGQLDVVGFQIGLIVAEDVVTGSADPWTHTMVSSTIAPLDQTIWQSVGADVGPVQQVFYDARASRWELRSSVESPTLTAASTIVALNAAEFAGTLPTARDSGDDPLRHFEGVTRVGGVALVETRSVNLNVDTGIDVIRGQSVAPVGWDTSRKGSIAHAADGVVTDQTLPVLYDAIYDTTTPTGGTRVSDEVAYTSIEQTLVREAGRRELTITTPRVVVEPGDITLAPRAEGGPIDFTIGGTVVEDGTGTMLRVVIRSGARDPYVA